MMAVSGALPVSSTVELVVAIVDDDAGVRGSLESLLRSVGWIGRPFADGAALLLSGEEGGISCIITDLNMPEMSGLALQAEMTRRGWTQPVIMMTAFPTDTARDQALAGGAHAFLVKPVDPDALLDAVEQAVA
jgi:FixJ family two-component response regulator